MIHLTARINSYIIDADEQKHWHDVIDGMTEYRGYFAHSTEGRETTITITIPEDISPSIFFAMLTNAQAHTIEFIMDSRL